MTDFETAIMIKNMAREMVSALSVKNAPNINETISRRIVDAVKKGKTIKDAVNEVLGAGTYEKLSDDVYEDLRKKATGKNANAVERLKKEGFSLRDIKRILETKELRQKYSIDEAEAFAELRKMGVRDY